MKPILIVDDDELILQSYAKICATEYSVVTALSGNEGLSKLADGPEYAVVVSDMSMPGMQGSEFLAHVRARWPDTVRIMLTGDRDQGTAVRAVNQANVFRFLNKPSPLATVLQTVKDGVRQHELIVAEKELLEKTLNGSVQILMELLSAADSSQLVRSRKLRERASAVAKQLGWENVWEVEIAATLRQIGAMTIPAEVVAKARRGQSLGLADQQTLARIPEIGATLLSRIPRLGGVGEIIRYQAKHFDGTGFPPNSVAGEAIPKGARLIKILTDVLALESTGVKRDALLAELSSRVGWYDETLLAVVAASNFSGSPGTANGMPLPLKELRVGHRLLANIVTREGVVLVSSGYVVTEAVLERLENFAALIGINEPIYVDPAPPEAP